jgi:hypothetical protein
MPENGLETLKQYDAILFRTIGDKRVPDDVRLPSRLEDTKKWIHAGKRA